MLGTSGLAHSSDPFIERVGVRYLGRKRASRAWMEPQDPPVADRGPNLGADPLGGQQVGPGDSEGQFLCFVGGKGAADPGVDDRAIPLCGGEVQTQRDVPLFQREVDAEGLEHAPAR